jgi:hypothetical protein
MSLEFLLERKRAMAQASWESEYQQNPLAQFPATMCCRSSKGLRACRTSIVGEGNLLKVVLIAEATGTGAVNVGAGQPGFGVLVVPLRYTSAATVAKTADNSLSIPTRLHQDRSS